jgi:hypothetical protein
MCSHVPCVLTRYGNDPLSRGGIYRWPECVFFFSTSHRAASNNRTAVNNELEITWEKAVSSSSSSSSSSFFFFFFYCCFYFYFCPFSLWWTSAFSKTVLHCCRSFDLRLQLHKKFFSSPSTGSTWLYLRFSYTSSAFWFNLLAPEFGI